VVVKEERERKRMAKVWGGKVVIREQLAGL
jgi:hypothetical protein